MMMKTTYNRRHFLRAAGVSLGLPMLESFFPKGYAAVTQPGAQGIRRMVAICSPLGFHTPFLFPEKAGKDYQPTPYLEPLQPYRDHFSVLSGLQHPDVDGGHAAESSFLTAAPHPGAPSFRNSISVDQFAAESIGHHTRFPSLILSANYNNGISYTRSGVRVPPEVKPSKLYEKMFLEGSQKEKEQQVRRLQDGRSVLDLVNGQLKQIGRKVGSADVEVLDQYATGVRELEVRMLAAEEWAEKAKPEVEAAPPKDIEDRADFVGQMALLYDLMFLALRTDSTRLITFLGAGGDITPPLKGVEGGWHNLSHHGKDPQKIEQLAIIELEEFRLLADFLGKLQSVKEGDATLLDQTAIFLGSNLGNASSHNNINLPVILAGGHFEHGQHLAFDPQKGPPLANLFVSCLQHLGIEAERFASGDGVIPGLGKS
ncbi:MAG: DUF1552 domain-containing protein [Verrucomicrobiales bacterium]